MDVEPSFPPPPEARRHFWLACTRGLPPEDIAVHIQSAQASWLVAVEDGPDNDRKHYLARLEDPRDLPYWAFALAKAYLDDVGEWPLFGSKAELALDAYEEHQDHERAVREVLAAVLPVWPEVTVTHVGREIG